MAFTLFLKKRQKEWSDDLIWNGIVDPKDWVRCGIDMINNVNQNDFLMSTNVI
jgi:hypothetical protein